MNKLIYAAVLGLIITFTVFCGAGLMVGILILAQKVFSGTLGPMVSVAGAMFFIIWAVITVGVWFEDIGEK